MLKDFVHSTKYVHEARLHEYLEKAQRAADWSEEHPSSRRIRRALGQRLISLGERLVESPASELGPIDKAA